MRVDTTCNAVTKNGSKVEVCELPFPHPGLPHDSGRYQWEDDGDYMGTSDRVVE